MQIFMLNKRSVRCTGGPGLPIAKALRKSHVPGFPSFCCRAERIGRFCLHRLEAESCGNEGLVASCGVMGGCSAGQDRGGRAVSREPGAGTPWQLLGKARWVISKRESARNVDFTEQLLCAVRLFPGGNFMCWDCQNEISPFQVHGKF